MDPAPSPLSQKPRIRDFRPGIEHGLLRAGAPSTSVSWGNLASYDELASASVFTQIAEERVSGAVVRSYVYGPQRIAMNDAAGVHYYGYDAHSGVRLLLDGQGNVTVKSRCLCNRGEASSSSLHAALRLS